VDSRNKILNPEAAPRACSVVTGTFDVLLAEDARELAEIRARCPGTPLLVVVLPLSGPLLPQRARAELVAALRVVDYVVTVDDDAPNDATDVAKDVATEVATTALLASLEPAQLVRLEAVHATRKRQLMEHVHRRQTS
jgi:bifunctional ADP-heptose synthase (sugar kinase/adenylyltransferase)